MAAILANSPEPVDSEGNVGKMRDVSVYLWNDVDLDGFADGYTVTTGSFTWDPEVTPSFTGPPDDDHIN